MQAHRSCTSCHRACWSGRVSARAILARFVVNSTPTRAPYRPPQTVPGSLGATHGGSRSKSPAHVRSQRPQPLSTTIFYHRDGGIRTIPACAGEPLRRLLRSSNTGDDPRVCGGTTYYIDDVFTEEGRSPRVRGNLGVIAVVVPRIGTIPACAGEPLRASGCLSGIGDDPRVCGGTRNQPIEHHTSRGRSPRVRGNPADLRLRTLRHGTIPACAGEPDHHRM